MTFPETPLDVRAELYLGDSLGWVDVTGDLQTGEPVTITRGRQPRAQQVDPGSCTLRLNNSGGRYSPRNPRSPYYGLLGRNTPLRVSVPGSESYLALDGSTDGIAATAGGHAFGLSTALDVRIELTTDWMVLGRDRTLIGQYDGASGDGWVLRITSDGLLALFQAMSGPDAGASGPLFSALPERSALRATWVADNGDGFREWTFYWADSLDGPWTWFASYADGVVDTMTDSALPLQIAPSYTSSSGAPRSPLEGLVHRAEVRTSIDGPIVAAPDFRNLAPGTEAFTDSAGLDWTLAGTATVSDRAYRFHGEVSEWPPRWAPSGAGKNVVIQAAGVKRRMGQGAPALQSTLRRRIPGGGGQAVPRAYWPMEEGSYATQAYSPLPGVPPLRTKGLRWASDDSLFGSDALPTLGQSASIDARPDPTSPSLGGWTVDLSYRLEKLPSNARQFLSVRLTGATAARVEVNVSTAGVEIAVYDAEGTRLNGFTATDPNALAAFVGAWNRLQVFSATSGGQTYAVVSWRDVVTGISWMVGAPYTGGPGVLTRVAGNWGQDLSGMAIGHLGIWGVGGAVTSTSPLRFATGITYFDDADDGYVGESAWARMNRLSAEEQVPIFARTGDEVSELVGPQRVQSLLGLLEEAAEADGGVLYEHRRTPALAFRSRSSLYDQTPGLVLDYAAGQVAPPLEPVDDDEGVANDVTVTRTGGSSGHAVETEGPLSVQPPPDGIGLVNESVTLNLGTDAQTEPMAHWLLHLGTTDEARYPTVAVRLHQHPELIEQVLATDVMDRVQILNPPDDVPPGTIELLAEGYTEVLLPRSWDIAYGCSPGSPWLVGHVARDSELLEDFADTEQTIPLVGGGALPWTRTNGQAHSGAWSLRSGAITNNETSDAVLTLPDDAGTVSFWYRTSSEQSGPGFEGDRFTVLVDGVQQLRAQGETPWTEYTMNVAGASTVIFRYTKDNSASAGSDAAWIDDLRVSIVESAPDRPTRADTDGSVLAAAADADDTSVRVLTVQDPADGSRPVWVTAAGGRTNLPGEFPFDVRTGGEVMRATGITPFAYDSFTRTVSAGWGTTTSGRPWATSGGSAANFSVDGSRGVIALAATPSSLRFAEITENLADCEVLTSITPAALAVGGEHLPGVLLRAVAGPSFYWVNLALGASGSVALEARNVVTPVGARATTRVTYAAGTKLWLRARVVGHRVLGRVWRDGTREPGWWQIDRTVTSGTVAAGTCGVAVASTSTAASPTFRYDDFRIVNPQTMTVTRSVNGISKGHAAGADVRLAHPAIVAL